MLVNACWILIISQGHGSYPFDKVIYCNIGDCHACGQQPLTFLRQVVSACVHPEGSESYPEDVRERARLLLEDARGGSLGRCGIAGRKERTEQGNRIAISAADRCYTYSTLYLWLPFVVVTCGT